MDSLRLEPVLREFPDYRYQGYFEAALELFRMRITATVLQRRDFPIIGQFMLRAIDLGYRTPTAIARLLGVEEQDLKGAGALLLSSGMLTGGPVTESGHREYLLTLSGHSALEGNRELTVPRRRILDLHYNPLTRHLLPRERDICRARQIRDQGIFVIRATKSPIPSLGDFTIQDVRTALAADREDASIEVIRLLDLAEPFAEYIRGIHVFLLQHRQTGDERLVAYRGFHYLPVESQALDQAHRAGTFQLPGDAVAVDDTRWVTTVGLSDAATGAVSAALAVDRRVQELQLDLVARHAAHEQEADEFHRRDYEEEIRRLAGELIQVQQERDDLTKRVKEAHGTELIVTEDHRSVLDTAFKQAQQEVIIISPWMNLRAVDDALIDLMKGVIQRGITIRIGHGIGNHRGDAEDERNRRSANAVKRRILQRIGEHAGRLQIIEIGNTHEKILICDRSFAVTGSFNWLSYRGEIDAGYRRETSVLVRDTESVQKLAERALEALGTRRGAAAPNL